MQLRFDGGLVEPVAHRLRGQAAGFHELAAAIRQIDGQLSEVAVAGGVHTFSAVCAEALDLIAIDLDLLGGCLAAAIRSYDTTELAIGMASSTDGR
jgi:hypothetical protein